MAIKDPTKYDYPPRTLCAVLNNMRKCVSTLNLAPLAGLIEEAQLLGDKMEAGLEIQGTLKEWQEARGTLKKEIRALVAKRDKLSKKPKGK